MTIKSGNIPHLNNILLLYQLIGVNVKFFLHYVLFFFLGNWLYWGIGVLFGGPGHKDLGAGEKKVSASGWWELEKYFCGRVSITTPSPDLINI